MVARYTQFNCTHFIIWINCVPFHTTIKYQACVAQSQLLFSIFRHTHRPFFLAAVCCGLLFLVTHSEKENRNFDEKSNCIIIINHPFRALMKCTIQHVENKFKVPAGHCVRRVFFHFSFSILLILLLYNAMHSFLILACFVLVWMCCVRNNLNIYHHYAIGAEQIVSVAYYVLCVCFFFIDIVHFGIDYFICL